jgi:hypothetical protein
LDSTPLVFGGSPGTLRLNKAHRSSFINLAANARNRNARARGEVAFVLNKIAS